MLIKTWGLEIFGKVDEDFATLYVLDSKTVGIMVKIRPGDINQAVNTIIWKMKVLEESS